MRLNSLQKLFLAQFTFAAEKPLTAVARALNTSVPRMRYALQGLLDAKVIRVMPQIDRGRLGYTDYNIYFSIAVSSSAARNAFVKELSGAPGVVFFAELGGDFQYEMIIAARSAQEASRLLDEVSERHQVRMHSKSLGAGIKFCLYLKRYFLEQKGVSAAKSQPLGSAGEPPSEVFTLDRENAQLLRILSTGKAPSLRELGQALGIAHSAVRHRLLCLREQQILGALYYDVEPLEYGYQDFALQFVVSHDRRALEKRFFATTDRFSAVSYAASYFGAWDFELGIEVQQADHINAAAQHLAELLGPDFNCVRMLMRFRQLALRPYPF